MQKGGIMMRKIKTICYVLVACLIFNLSIPALAVSNEQATLQEATHKTHIDNSLIEKYAEYELNIPKMYENEINSEDKISGVPILDILKNTPVLEDYVTGDMSITVYDGTVFQDYLPDFKEILEIAKIDAVIYVQYITKSGNRVTISYLEDGSLNEKFITDYENDIGISIQGVQAVVYEDLLTAGQVELSQETIAAIDVALANNEMQELESIPGINVTYSEEGSPTITIADGKGDNSDRSRSVKTNFVLPQRQFPEYTKRQVARQSKYIPALKRNTNVTVKQSMNTYRETRADKTSFYFGASLATIGGVVGIVGTTLSNVLAGIGVAVSAAGYIREAVTLYKSASYDYIGFKEGYVYDSTYYRQDVKVIHNRSMGVLHGGNNSSGKFTWIDYQPSPALKRDTYDIINKATYNYNANIALNKYCSLYYPD